MIYKPTACWQYHIMDHLGRYPVNVVHILSLGQQGTSGVRYGYDHYFCGKIRPFLFDGYLR